MGSAKQNVLAGIHTNHCPESRVSCFPAPPQATATTASPAAGRILSAPRVGQVASTAVTRATRERLTQSSARAEVPPGGLHRFTVAVIRCNQIRRNSAC